MLKNVPNRPQPETDAIKEHQEILDSHIFDEDRATAIRKTRKDFEDRLHNSLKQLSDIYDYLKFEKKLMREIKKSAAQNDSAQPKELLESIVTKIKKIYSIGVTYYACDVSIWANFIHYLKKQKCFGEASEIIEKLIDTHSTNPGAWCDGAVFEYDENNNYERSRNYFVKGIQKHSSFQILHEQFLRVQLTEIERLKKDSIEAIKEAKDIYIDSKKYITDVDYFINVLDIVHKYKFARSIEALIVCDLLTFFSDNARMWHTLSYRTLFGIPRLFPSDPEQSQEFEEIAMTDDPNCEVPRVKPFRLRLQLCIDTYKQATQTVKTQIMWSYYLKTLRSLQTNMKVEREFKQKVFIDAYRSGYNQDFLTAKDYVHYMQLIVMNNRKDLNFIEIARRSTSKYRDNPELWKLWLIYHAKKYQDDAVMSIFQNGVAAIGLNSLELWQILLEYYQTRPDKQHRIEEVFMEAVQQPSCIADYFKPYFVEWLVITKNLNAGRQMFVQLAVGTDPCYDMHKTMFGIESIQITRNVDEWRKCLDITLALFGTCKSEAWSEYINFERNYGDQENIDRLVTKAKTTLKENILPTFNASLSTLLSETK